MSKRASSSVITKLFAVIKEMSKLLSLEKTLSTSSWRRFRLSILPAVASGVKHSAAKRRFFIAAGIRQSQTVKDQARINYAVRKRMFDKCNKKRVRREINNAVRKRMFDKCNENKSHEDLVEMHNRSTRRICICILTH